MNILEQLTALRDKLGDKTSTQRCLTEQLVLLERIIKMVNTAKMSFSCDKCVLWERSKGQEEDWGICRLNNAMPMTHENDWCYEGKKVTDEHGHRSTKG